MKALTIMQPYAGAIMDGRKRVENRTWTTLYRGSVLIHVGKNKIGLKTWDESTDGPLPDPMPYGAVVGIAELTTIYDYEGLMLSKKNPELYGRVKHEWILTHHHASGPFLWVLENVRKLETPIPWTGKQGLWNGSEIIESDAWKNNKLIPVSPHG